MKVVSPGLQRGLHDSKEEVVGNMPEIKAES